MKFGVALRVGSLLALNLVFATVACAERSYEPLIQLNNDAVKAINRKDYESALSLLKEALKIDPTYSIARTNLGIACIEFAESSADKTQAVRLLHEAAWLYQDNVHTIFPEQDWKNADPVTYLQARYLYCRDNRATTVLNDTITKMGKDPSNFDTRVELSGDAFRQGDYIGALIELREALKLKSGAPIHDKLGDCYYGLRRQQEATDEYLAAKKTDDSALLEEKLSQAYRAQKEYVKALAALKSAYELTLPANRSLVQRQEIKDLEKEIQDLRKNRK